MKEKQNMFNQNIKRGLGISLIVISILLSLFNLTFTGAVIGAFNTNYLSYLGILIFLVGVILLLEERKEEKKNIATITEREARKIYSLGEAARRGMIGSYIAGKRLIFETTIPARSSGGGYSKHTKYVQSSISEEDFLNQVGSESQYPPQYSIEQIHQFEERVARKGRGEYKGEHQVRVYGSSPQVTGADNHKPVKGIAVDLQETKDGILVHSHPIPEKSISQQISKKIFKRRKRKNLLKIFIKS